MGKGNKIGIDKYHSPFAERLRTLLDEQGVSRQRLGKAIGIARQSISAYADGSSVPDIGKFQAIADFFGVSYDYLLGYSDSKTRKNADIVRRTGLSEKAISVLGAVKDSETSQSELQFINDLLSDRAAIYFISAAYEEYKQIQRYEKHIKPSPTEDEPFIVVSRGAMIDINESKAKLALALFTCQNRFLNFIQKEEV